MKKGYVYILANRKNGALYIGVTSDLSKRIYAHKEGILKDSFTEKHDIKKLVYYEELDEIYNAIEREKQLKNWRRQWKINLINDMNPDWGDLYKKLNE